VPDDPYALAEGAAAALLDRLDGFEPTVAVVLGSGWLPALDALGDATSELATSELPGFPAPTVAGHQGSVRTYERGTTRVVVLVGRVHFYEGRTVAEVVHPVRTAVLAGCSTVVLTNAAGGLHPEWAPGTAVLIKDHLNLTNLSPMAGAPPTASYASRFVDLTEVYAPALRELARRVDPTLPEGVYAALRGAHYETPAEIGMLRTLGADLVGMSTALEAIAARHLGAAVLGISLVTNLAAGVSPTPLNHAEVLEAGAAAAPRLGTLLDGVLTSL